jgi:hypothetical protein
MRDYNILCLFVMPSLPHHGASKQMEQTLPLPQAAQEQQAKADLERHYRFTVLLRKRDYVRSESKRYLTKTN